MINGSYLLFIGQQNEIRQQITDKMHDTEFFIRGYVL